MRALDAVMRDNAGALKGWKKVDLTSPFAMALFSDALSAAISTAKASELRALVERVSPRAVREE